jgi:hypothetical protein
MLMSEKFDTNREEFGLKEVANQVLMTASEIDRYFRDLNVEQKQAIKDQFPWLRALKISAMNPFRDFVQNLISSGHENTHEGQSTVLRLHEEKLKQILNIFIQANGDNSSIKQ